jgi:hypothetical protein
MEADLFVKVANIGIPNIKQECHYGMAASTHERCVRSRWIVASQIPFCAHTTPIARRDMVEN